MGLRENTDARYVPPPSSATHPGRTIRPCSENNDLQLTMPSARLTRELAARESDGIHVALHWHPDDEALTVSVEDERSGHRFQLAVAADRALDAFYHPYAYAA